MLRPRPPWTTAPMRSISAARGSARAQAAGNSAEEIARVVEYAHRFGVRVHATLNTLVWDDELEAAERQARSLIDAGVDALIVQDMALRRMDLPVELHASTQVSNRTPEGARFLGEAGFARVILERNLTLEEIRADLRRHRGRGRMLRPRGGLRGVQRPLFPLAVDVRAQRQSRGVQPALPPDVGPHRRKGPDLDCREASAVGTRHESFATHWRSAGCGRHFIQDRRSAQGSRLYPERCGTLPPGGGRGAGPAAGAGAVVRRRERPGFHARPVEEFYTRGVRLFSWTESAPEWRRSTPRRRSANGWAAWRAFRAARSRSTVRTILRRATASVS